MIFRLVSLVLGLPLHTEDRWTGKTIRANAKSNGDGGDNYAINADQPASLATNVAALNTAAGSGSPLLGIRFYDLSTASGVDGSGDPDPSTEPTAPSADTAPHKGCMAVLVRYNTIMDAAWVWSDDSTITMLLNETDGTVNDSVHLNLLILLTILYLILELEGLMRLEITIIRQPLLTTMDQVI